MTGTSASSALDLRRSQTSYPSISGMLMSSRIKSGGFSTAAARANRPSGNEFTTCPSCRSMSSNNFRFAGISSTIMTPPLIKAASLCGLGQGSGNGITGLLYAAGAGESGNAHAQHLFHAPQFREIHQSLYPGLGEDCAPQEDQQFPILAPNVVFEDHTIAKLLNRHPPHIELCLCRRVAVERFQHARVELRRRPELGECGARSDSAVQSPVQFHSQMEHLSALCCVSGDGCFRLESLLPPNDPGYDVQAWDLGKKAGGCFGMSAKHFFLIGREVLAAVGSFEDLVGQRYATHQAQRGSKFVLPWVLDPHSL